mmetsp:Transcript_27512/g.48628  ORF Transcript_27512/g.48628 Transcript_27512/m.48628 type:complete len:302 (-) Transcript_27512:190-1095(-)
MVLVLTIWDLVARALDCDMLYVAVAVSLMICPFLWNARWSALAWINAFAVFVSTLAGLAIISVICNEPKPAANSLFTSIKDIPDSRKFIFSIGLQMVALGSGTPAIPSIHIQAKHKHTFTQNVIVPSFVMITIFVLIITVAGYCAYRDETKVMVTDNLIKNQIFGLPMALLIAAATFATLPAMVTMTADPIVALCVSQQHNHVSLGEREMRLLRYALHVALSIGSYLLLNYIDILLQITGLLCMSMTAIVLPCLMSLKVFWNEDSSRDKAFFITAIAGSTIATLTYMFFLLEGEGSVDQST